MRLQDVLEHRPELRGELAGDLDVAQPDVTLGLAALAEERLADEHPHGIGDARCRLAHDARDLEHALLGQSRLTEQRRAPGRLHVGVGELPRVGIREREAEREPVAPDEVGVDARALEQLTLGVDALTGERVLDRQEREPVLRARLAQAVVRHAGGLELGEEREPRLALLTDQP